MPTRLTEPAIRRALRDAADTVTRRDLADAGQPGLRLRVTPRGTATWVLSCRDSAGRMRRFRIGGFPGMGLSEARQAARSLYPRVKDGADPIADRKRNRAAAEAAREGVGTLGALLDLYGRQRGDAQRTWPQGRRRIELIFASILDKPLTTLGRRDFQLLADAHPSQASASYAVRAVRPVLKWGVQRDYCGDDLVRLHPPAPVRRRQRVLASDELARLLPVLAMPGDPYAIALRFMLWTLARREEVCGARWREIDLAAATWTIGGERNKSARTHVVPLSHQALALLHAIRPEHVDPDGRVFVSSTGGRLGNWDLATKRVMAATSTSGWHRHDLRRTSATLLGNLGTDPHVIEAALGHVTVHSGLASIYNTSRYTMQVREALQRLADALDLITAGEQPGGSVVPLRPAAVGG